MLPLDSQYLERFLGGEERAFEELVFRYQERLIYFIMRYVKDSTIAERLAQEVFADLYRQKSGFLVDCTLRCYLFQFARKKAKKYLHRNRNHLQLAHSEHVIQDKSRLEQRLYPDGEKARLCKTISQFPKRLRTVAYLSELEEMNEAEIARIVRLPDCYVRYLLRQVECRLSKTMWYVREDLEEC
ncbi:MAG: RNA polymerase sigma factor [Massiliimalia sp.]|jgi:RNA polymerase sigma-70 factor (ECF subfamily)